MKKNLIVIISALIVIAVLLCVGLFYRKPEALDPAEEISLTTAMPAEATEVPATEPTEEATEIPAEEPMTESAKPTGEAAKAPEATLKPATGYVLVRLEASDRYGLLPLSQDESYTYPLTQQWADGSETVNVVLVEPDGVTMQSSTCDNQNCVGEGKVTFENRTTRVLGNCIICAPNLVTLELYTAEEVEEMTSQQSDE